MIWLYASRASLVAALAWGQTMNKAEAQARTLRVIAKFSDELTADWSGSDAWFDAVQEITNAIVDLRDGLSHPRYAALLATAALAFKQYKIEKAVEEALSKAEGGVHTGYCPIGDVTYCGDDQPIIHGDETLDLEDYSSDGEAGS